MDALCTFTERMRALARYFGGQAETINAIAHRSMRRRGATGDKQAKADLGSVLPCSPSFTLAGWSAFDSAAHLTPSVGTSFAH